MVTPEIIIAGCGGAMGRAILRVLHERQIAPAGGFERNGAGLIGEDLGVLAASAPSGVPVTDLAGAQFSQNSVVIDFTTPQASLAIAEKAVRHGAALVIGATGFNAAQERAINGCAEKIAIVKSGNMSLGVNLLCALVEKAAAALGDEYDIEITEAHHRRKLDAPSGTALMLGAAAAAGRGVSLSEKSAPTRDGVTDQRKAGDIGFAVMRGGGIVGDHGAHFAGDKEILTLSHRAMDRALFAEGAVAAARWVAGKPPGLYAMSDVLGL